MNYLELTESFTSKVINKAKETTQEEKRENLFNIKEDIIKCLLDDLHLESNGIDNGIAYLGKNHKYLKYYEKDNNIECKTIEDQNKVGFMVGFQMESQEFPEYIYCPIVIFNADMSVIEGYDVLGVEVLVYDKRKPYKCNPIIYNKLRDTCIKSYFIGFDDIKYENKSDFFNNGMLFWDSVQEVIEDWISWELNIHKGELYHLIKESFTSNVVKQHKENKEEKKKEIIENIGGKPETLDEAEKYFRKIANDNGFYVVNDSSKKWNEVDRIRLNENEIKIYYNGLNFVVNICFLERVFAWSREQSIQKKIKRSIIFGIGQSLGTKPEYLDGKVYIWGTPESDQFRQVLYEKTGNTRYFDKKELEYKDISLIFNVINIIKPKKLDESFTNDVIKKINNNEDKIKDDIKNSLVCISDPVLLKETIVSELEKAGATDAYKAIHNTKNKNESIYYTIGSSSYLFKDRQSESIFYINIYTQSKNKNNNDSISIYGVKNIEFPDCLFIKIIKSFSNVKVSSIKENPTKCGYKSTYMNIKKIIEAIVYNLKKKLNQE